MEPLSDPEFGPCRPLFLCTSELMFDSVSEPQMPGTRSTVPFRLFTHLEIHPCDIFEPLAQSWFAVSRRKPGESLLGKQVSLFGVHLNVRNVSQGAVPRSPTAYRLCRLTLSDDPPRARTVSLCSQSLAGDVKWTHRMGTSRDDASLVQCSRVSTSAFVLSATRDQSFMSRLKRCSKHTNCDRLPFS